MPTEASQIELTMDELRAIAAYSAECALRVLPIFERDVPGDSRPREAIDAAIAFAQGEKRTNRLRAIAMAAFKAASQANTPAAVDAARSATLAASAAYLHPLADPDQVKHILGAAAHAARAAELDAGDDGTVGAENLEWARRHTPPSVVAVLVRYPPAPPGGGRVGELMRELDAALRS